MKKILLFISLICSLTIYGQETEKIEYLNYAGNKIKVPENCTAKSEYELLECNGTSAQWIYLNKKMLKSVPNQFIGQFEKQKSVSKKTKIKVESFENELKGYKFKIDNEGKISYRIIVYGTVNNQPLLLNIGTIENIKKTSDLNDFLKNLISIE